MSAAPGAWAGTGLPGAEGRLRDLAREVTVAVHAAPREDAEFWGSGLLVAPQWVLTCAHVLVRRDGLGRRRWAGDEGVGVRVGGRMVPGAVVYALPSPQTITQGWDPGDDREFDIFPDLALIRLTRTVEHGCAWLSDRAVPPVTRSVAALGWRRNRDELWSWDGTCDVVGNDGAHVFRLGPDSEIPAGVSGSLVVDLAHGRVIGVVKARRRNRDGGKAVRLSALRALDRARPLVPELSLGPDPYQRLMSEHDRWHCEQQGLLRESRSTWIDVQGRLDAVMGEWSPYDRAQALGLLAALPPPRSGGVVQRLVERVLGAGTVRDPLPVAWRDGHGLLYEPENGKQLLAFVTYLLLVSHEVADAAPERAAALRDFAARRAMSLPAPDRMQLAGLDRPADAAAGAASVLVALSPVVWERNLPVRFRWEIQLVRGPGGSQITTVCDRREGVEFDEAVAQVQEPLALALDRADEAGVPAAVEIALPVHHFDVAAHLWAPGSGLPGRPHRPARPMGSRRAVVLRDVERVPPPPEWRERWRQLTDAERLAALPVPAAGPGPGYEELRHAPAGSVPVLCGRVGAGGALETMMDVLDAGHGVALWRGVPHPPGACGPPCEEFRRDAAVLLAGLVDVRALPEAVRALRAQAHDGRPAGAGGECVALLYDDADHPLPGSWAGEVPGPR